MSEDMQDLVRRVTALEKRVDLEAALRAAVDRDLSSLGQRQQATNLMIQALQITQSEHTKTLDQHTKTLDQHTKTLDQHTKTLERHSQILDGHTVRLDDLQTGQGTIIAMLERLIARE